MPPWRSTVRLWVNLGSKLFARAMTSSATETVRARGQLHALCVLSTASALSVLSRSYVVHCVTLRHGLGWSAVLFTRVILLGSREICEPSCTRFHIVCGQCLVRRLIVSTRCTRCLWSRLYHLLLGELPLGGGLLWICEGLSRVVCTVRARGSVGRLVGRTRFTRCPQLCLPARSLVSTFPRAEDV